MHLRLHDLHVKIRYLATYQELCKNAVLSYTARCLVKRVRAIATHLQLDLGITQRVYLCDEQKFLRKQESVTVLHKDFRFRFEEIVRSDKVDIFVPIPKALVSALITENCCEHGRCRQVFGLAVAQVVCPIEVNDIVSGFDPSLPKVLCCIYGLVTEATGLCIVALRAMLLANTRLLSVGCITTS